MENGSSLASGSSTDPHPFTSGKMSWEFRRILHKGRAESREIRSCFCSSVWGNIAHSRPMQENSRRERGCLHVLCVRGVQPCQGLGGAILARVGAPCPHPSASGEDANLESRRHCPHRRGRIDCRNKVSQTRCRGLERRCTVAVGKPWCASAWNEIGLFRT